MLFRSWDEHASEVQGIGGEARLSVPSKSSQQKTDHVQLCIAAGLVELCQLAHARWPRSMLVGGGVGGLLVRGVAAVRRGGEAIFLVAVISGDGVEPRKRYTNCRQWSSSASTVFKGLGGHRFALQHNGRERRQRHYYVGKNSGWWCAGKRKSS